MNLNLQLPLPPPDNALHRSGSVVRYPTQRYKDWLQVCEDLLAEHLPAGHQADTEAWWSIRLSFYMPARGDMPNREKAILDLLAGSTLRGGKIEKSGRGLFDDDRRVAMVTKVWMEIGTPTADAYVYVQAAKLNNGVPLKYTKPKAPARQKTKQNQKRGK